MRAVIQRVKWAKVEVDGKLINSVNQGLLTLLGVAKGDTEVQLTKLITKILELRIFEDDAGKMNLSLKDVKGQHLIVSQFTLYGDCSQGKRPGFSSAEEPVRARQMYEKALAESTKQGIESFGGEFGADMQVSLQNDGPATFILEV